MYVACRAADRRSAEGSSRSLACRCGAGSGGDRATRTNGSVRAGCARGSGPRRVRARQAQRTRSRLWRWMRRTRGWRSPARRGKPEAAKTMHRKMPGRTRRRRFRPRPAGAFWARRNERHIRDLVLDIGIGRVMDPVMGAVVQVVSEVHERPAAASVHQLAVDQPFHDRAGKQHRDGSQYRGDGDVQHRRHVGCRKRVQRSNDQRRSCPEGGDAEADDGEPAITRQGADSGSRWGGYGCVCHAVSTMATTVASHVPNCFTASPRDVHTDH